MKKIDAIKHFGSQERLAEALSVAQSTISGSWGVYPPDARQLQIEHITQGALKAEPGALNRVMGLDKISRKQLAKAV